MAVAGFLVEAHMEIISEPATITEEVTDLDIGMLDGQVFQHTLTKKDHYEIDEDHAIRITYADGEQVVCLLAPGMRYRTKHRTITRPVAPPAGQKPVGAAPAPAEPPQREDAWSLRVR